MLFILQDFFSGSSTFIRTVPRKPTGQTSKSERGAKEVLKASVLLWRAQFLHLETKFTEQHHNLSEQIQVDWLSQHDLGRLKTEESWWKICSVALNYLWTAFIYLLAQSVYAMLKSTNFLPRCNLKPPLRIREGLLAREFHSSDTLHPHEPIIEHRKNSTLEGLMSQTCSFH